MRGSTTTRAAQRRSRSRSEQRHALYRSTNDLRLSLFDGAPFRSIKAAIKRHASLDLRSAIAAFIPISDGTLHGVTG